MGFLKIGVNEKIKKSGAIFCQVERTKQLIHEIPFMTKGNQK
jgi:hypothetical protein